MQYRSALALCVLLAMSSVSCEQQVSPEQHLRAGAQLQEQRQLEEAIDEYDEAIRLDPWLDEAYTQRGLAYAGMGQFQRAIQDFNVAITLNPQGTEGFFLRCSVQYSLGKYQLALDDLSEAIRLNPNDARVYGARGQCIPSWVIIKRPLKTLTKPTIPEPLIAPSGIMIRLYG